MSTVMSTLEAEAFAIDWMEAWNSHDPDRIVAHYHHDVEYHSPFVARITGDGVLRGRRALRDYVAAALQRYPELHFGPEYEAAAGAGSVVIRYRSVDDLLAMEAFVLDEQRLVTRVHCHYVPAPAR